MDSQDFKLFSKSVPAAFGSCTVTYGYEGIQIVCAIKAEIMKPLKSEP